MGNRCFITTKSRKIGVYLQWNGGYDSVRAFLRYCELQGYREPDKDSYGWARLCQVVGNFFGGSLSVGIGTDVVDPGDNGIFIIEGWHVENISEEYTDDDNRREMHTSVDSLERQYKDGYDMQEFLEAIDEKMPEHCRLGDFLKARQIPISEAKLGQIIFREGLDGWMGRPCLGFGEDRMVNGRNVKGLPYADFLRRLEDYTDDFGRHHEPESIEKVVDNPNSYLAPDYINKGLCWAIPMEE